MSGVLLNVICTNSKSLFIWSIGYLAVWHILLATIECIILLSTAIQNLDTLIAKQHGEAFLWANSHCERNQVPGCSDHRHLHIKKAYGKCRRCLHALV